MNSWVRDLRYSARRLVNASGFSLTVTLMLALGIGSITAIFSLIDGILLRPLPFHAPARLVQLGEHVGGNSGRVADQFLFLALFLDYLYI
jgi:putative ABC transport system permease protein